MWITAHGILTVPMNTSRLGTLALTWLGIFAFRFFLLPVRAPNVEPLLAALMPIGKRAGAWVSVVFAVSSIVVYDAITSGWGSWTLAAAGAYAALQAAGKENGVTIVSVDGGCAGVQNVQKGVIGATSQQYPGKMASEAMAAIQKYNQTGEKPTVTEGLQFFNTGVALVTDKPVSGVESITSAQGLEKCWGSTS